MTLFVTTQKTQVPNFRIKNCNLQKALKTKALVKKDNFGGIGSCGYI